MQEQASMPRIRKSLKYAKYRLAINPATNHTRASVVVGDARHPHADHELKMAVDDDYVTIPKSQFDYLRQHCEHCPYFGGQLGVLSDERAAVTPHERPSDEPLKKRKTLHDPPSTHLSQLKPQLPS